MERVFSSGKCRDGVSQLNIGARRIEQRVDGGRGIPIDNPPSRSSVFFSFFN